LNEIKKRKRKKKVRETLNLENDKHLTVPKRAFGHTGVKISKLCLGGGSFGSTDSQALLNDALRYGVDCWEIVSFSGNVYHQYFKNNPGIREKVFLSAKIYSTHPIIMQEQLDKVLKENGTSMIDFLAIHPVDDIKLLNDDVRKWVAKVKKQKKIRFFGFCTHKNMAACLSGAAELGWIDGIQTVYNYRMRNVKSVEEALKKCHARGIGIFAVKSMGLCVQKKNELQKLPLHKDKIDALLSDHKVSFEQAKLKSIWQNPKLTSICSLMPNATILRSNVAAAVDEHSLHPDIVKLLADYAHITAKYFCRRCGACETSEEDKVPIFDIMEILMYLRGYGKREWALNRFAQIPIEIQSKIRTHNYSQAEEKCPQQMPITQLMQEAYNELHPA
jgi:predicted aldo/keto reductase-like oxidoreductase